MNIPSLIKTKKFIMIGDFYQMSPIIQ